MLYGDSEIKNLPHEPEPGSSQSPQSQYDHAAPNETMACETMRDHVNINSVCEVM